MVGKRPSIKQAEAKAYAGSNESQDSQRLMDLYHREHGIGTLSSSPAQKKRIQHISGGRKQSGRSVRDLKADSGRPRVTAPAAKEPGESPLDAPKPRTRLAAVQNHSTTGSALLQAAARVDSSTPRSSLTWEPHGKDVQLSASEYDPAANVKAPSPLVKDDVLPQVPRSTAPLKTLKALKALGKMDDFMSESPTQSNEGRSYDQYLDHYDRGITSSQPADEHDQHAGPVDRDGHSQVSQVGSSHDHRTLHEDDTGAVKFNWNPPEYEADGDDDSSEEDNDASEPLLPTSQPMMRSQPSISALAVFGGRHSMPASTMPPPETPMVAQRPFQSEVSTGNIMGPSQMFMQTQFTSGVKKLASPTSSRPSPMIFEHNTISPNAISSPLKDRGLRTSPPTQNYTTSPYRIPETSSKSSEQRDLALETIPGSPSVVRAKLRSRPEPIGDYAPIRDSPLLENGTPMEELSSDSDDDESQERRRLAKLKQERANESLNNISFPRQKSRENIEVPSTNRKQQQSALTQSTTSALSTPDDYVQPCRGKADMSNDDSQETVADSQEGVLGVNAPAYPPLSNRAVDTRDIVVNVPTNSEPGLPSAPARSNETTGSKETIPETSPVGNKHVQSDVQKVPLEYVAIKRARLSPVRISLSEKQSSDETNALPSSPPVPIPVPVPMTVLASQASRRSSRLRVTMTPVPSSNSHAGEQEPATTSSTLTVLSVTPNISSSSTPNTEAADQHAKHANSSTADQCAKHTDSSPEIGTATLSSPAAAKNLRQKPSKLQTYSSLVTRGGNRAPKTTRQISVSTDELAISTPTSASRSRLSRSFMRKSLNDSRQVTSCAGLFHGMTFATSFQSDHEKKSVEKMITAAGGNIILKGFDELFEVGSLETSQTPGLKESHTVGFAALITDTHSRKPKYMQALALGLPCLSWKWISNCVRVNAIVDWSTYLLCAGQSQVLGAIRSRSLDAYDASGASINEVIGRRPMLLSNAKILIVMKKKSKKEEEKRMQYLFLTLVLGASLVRVGTLEEARMELKKQEETGESFDWVYVGGLQVEAEKTLFGQGQAAPKKRKRQSITEEVEEPPPKRVRTLNDEFIVQSLILGRLVEDGELEDVLP